MKMEQQAFLLLVEKLLRQLGPDIFKFTLNFLSDFDLVEFESYWVPRPISKFVTEVLNKRVGDNTAHSIIARHYYYFNKYANY